MFDFLLFSSVMLVYISVLYVDNVSHFELSVCFWKLKNLVLFWWAVLFFLLFDKMDRRNEENTKFCVKNEITCARRFKMLTVAFDESTMSRTQVQLWYMRFKEDRDSNHNARPGQIWRFCSLFYSIEIAWCILISCHNVVRSIRNTSLNLFGDCTKQFVRNAQNYGKINDFDFAPL